LRDTIEGLALTLYVGIPRTVWELFWVTSSPNGEALREAFRQIYGLHIGTIMEGDVEVEAIVPDTDAIVRYVEWAVFLVSPSASCLDGCQQSRFP